MDISIKKLTETILFEPFNYKGAHEGLHQFHQLFAAACGIAAGNIDDEDICRPAGKAVSPIKAAHC